MILRSDSAPIADIGPVTRSQLPEIGQIFSLAVEGQNGTMSSNPTYWRVTNIYPDNCRDAHAIIEDGDNVLVYVAPSSREEKESVNKGAISLKALAKLTMEAKLFEAFEITSSSWHACQWDEMLYGDGVGGFICALKNAMRNYFSSDVSHFKITSLATGGVGVHRLTN